MKKSDKKIENNLRKALTNACEEIKDVVEDFCWLTHEVNYQQFPQSLTIICYLSSQTIVTSMSESSLDMLINNTIKLHLAKAGIAPFNPNKQITYRSEN